MTRGRARILVVDDERFFREAIEETLTRHDFQCDACADGETALEWMRKTPYAVVVLDILLPGIDGVETLRGLREANPDSSVIMLSGATEEELVLQALREGACDYLAKPLHDEELILAVTRALATHSTLRQSEDLKDRLDLAADRIEELSQDLSSLDPDAQNELLATRAAAVLAELIDARKTSLMLLSRDGSALEAKSFVGRDVNASGVDPIPRGHGAAWICLQEGGVLSVEDIHRDDRFAVDPAPGRYDTDAFVIAPLAFGDTHFGVLCATDRIAEGPFTRSDIALLRILALQLAELFALAQRLAPEPAGSDPEIELGTGKPSGDLGATTGSMSAAAALAESEEGAPETRDGELTREICDAMIEEIKPERILGRAIRAIERVLGADPVAIYLFDPESGALALEATSQHGVRSERLLLAPDKGLTGMVFQTGHLVATNEPDSDPRFDFDADCPEDGRPGPLLCVPLRLRGKVVGLCRVHLPEALAVSARTGEMLVAVLSAAIRNVLLYRSLLESIEEVAVVRRESRG